MTCQYCRYFGVANVTVVLISAKTIMIHLKSVVVVMPYELVLILYLFAVFMVIVLVGP